MSYQSIESCYHTLGLGPGAGDADIRQAYRRLAKQLHPDRNKAPTAHQDFIALAEAYEYLIHHRDDGAVYTQQTYSQTYTQGSTEQPYSESRRREDARYAAQAEARAEARRRAAEHAEMRYDDFVNTDYYKSMVSIEILFKHLGALLGILLLVAAATALIVTSGGIWGVVYAAVFAGLPGGVLYLLMQQQGISLTVLHESLSFLARQRWFQAVGIVAVNLFVVVRIGFQTLIPLWSLPVIYFGVSLLSLLAIGRFAPRMAVGDKRFYSICMLPLLISFLFCINFVFARHAVSETYPYSRAMLDDRHESTEVILPDGTYDAYLGIRMFADYEQMFRTNYITYTFADGLLGLRVMKGYKFEGRY